MPTPTLTTTFTAVYERLRALEAERAAAGLEGMTDAQYLADLEREIVEARAAYVGAAVTEIASLRGELSGRLQG